MKHFVENQLSDVYEWGCKAKNNIPSDIQWLPKFTSTWCAQQNFMFYKKINNDTQFLVQCAMPCLRMFLDEISQKVTRDRSLAEFPVVYGFLYEAQCFSTLAVLTVKVGKDELKSFTVSGVLDCDRVTVMPIGMVYHLTYTYPVIDGVGYLKALGSENLSLVFIQVSISPYTQHKTKLIDLFDHAAPEDPNKSILQYYKELCSESIQETLYVYVSPYNKKKFFQVTNVKYAEITMHIK